MRWLGEYTDYERMRRFAYHERTFNVKRTEDLLEAMGNPEKACKSVHVTGTKGKGSTSHMIEAMIRASKSRTGLFTSPHLVSITERIRLDGRPIPESAFVKALLAAVDASDALPAEDGKPTFFELITCAAASAFADAGVEWAVYEVGLGGRLDSTNAIRHSACAITTVSLDHTEVLGDTVGKIAAEKAGILKGGEPCAVGRQDPDAMRVIEARAAERECLIWRFGAEIRITRGPAVSWTPRPSVSASISTPVREWNDAVAGLPGGHQAENMSVALGIMDILESRLGFAAGPETALRGLSSLRMPGRMDLVSPDPPLILDGAHNPASIRALVEALGLWPGRGSPLVVAAVSADKDVREIMRILAPASGRMFCTTSLSPRAEKPARLAELAREAGAKAVSVHESPYEAFEAARRAQRPGELLVVTGSFYLAGAAYRHFLGDDFEKYV